MEVVLLICGQFWGGQSMYSKSIQMCLSRAATDIWSPYLSWMQNARHACKEFLAAPLMVGFQSDHQGPLLLTWFNFNPSMDK